MKITALLDSGASHHLAPDDSGLSDVVPLTVGEPRSFLDANGRETHASHRGRMQAKIGKEGNLKITLQPVYIVGSTTNFLIAENALRGTGIRVRKEDNDNTVTLVDEEGKQTKIALQGNLCWVELEIDEQQTSSNEASAMTARATEDNDINKWHCRLGHASEEYLHRAKPSLRGQKLGPCHSCRLTRITRLPFPQASETRAETPFFRVHSDVKGPIPNTTGLEGERYILTFTCDMSRWVKVYPIVGRAEVPNKLAEYMNWVETRAKREIKILRCDNAREYLSSVTAVIMSKHGTSLELSTPHCPQQNGVAERMNRTLTEMVNVAMHASKLSKSLWAECYKHQAWVHNMMPHRSIDFNTPIALAFGHSPDLTQARVWGCVGYSYIEPQTSPIKPRGEVLYFVGHDENSKAYRMYNANQRRILVRRHVRFDERGIVENQLKARQVPRRLQEQTRETLQMTAMRQKGANGSGEPHSVKEVLSNDRAEQWIEAMKSELRSLEELGTWELTELPPGHRALTCKWVFKEKFHADGSPDKLKARIVARGFQQREGIDYKECSSPVVRYSTIRTLLALANQRNWEVFNIDVNTAFLNGNLQEEIYMRIPEMPGQTNDNKQVWRLKKGLYGLKQASAAWHDTLKETLLRRGFVATRSNECHFYTTIPGGTKVHILVYVDDIVAAGSDRRSVLAALKLVQDEFKTTEPKETTEILGMRIIRNKEAGKLHISNLKLARETGRCAGLIEARETSIPMNPGTPRAIELESVEGTATPLDKEETQKYQEIVGKIMYLTGTCRPDVGYATGYLSRYMHSPTKRALKAAKDTARYIYNTSEWGLQYTRINGSDDAEEIRVATDASFAADLTNRASSMGFVVSFGESTVSWKSGKLKRGMAARSSPTIKPASENNADHIARSTLEAEYLAACVGACEGIGLQRSMGDFSAEDERSDKTECPRLCGARGNTVIEDQQELEKENQRTVMKQIEIRVDNLGAVVVANRPKLYERTKHWALDCVWLREAVRHQEVKLVHCPGKQMPADGLTKALDANAFTRFREMIGMQEQKEAKIERSG